MRAAIGFGLLVTAALVGVEAGTGHFARNAATALTATSALVASAPLSGTPVQVAAQSGAPVSSPADQTAFPDAIPSVARTIAIAEVAEPLRPPPVSPPSGRAERSAESTATAAVPASAPSEPAAPSAAVAVLSRPVAAATFERDGRKEQSVTKRNVRGRKLVNVAHPQLANAAGTVKVRSVVALDPGRLKSGKAEKGVVVRRGSADVQPPCAAGQSLDRSRERCRPAKVTTVASGKKKPAA